MNGSVVGCHDIVAARTVLNTYSNNSGARNLKLAMSSSNTIMCAVLEGSDPLYMSSVRFCLNLTSGTSLVANMNVTDNTDVGADFNFNNLDIAVFADANSYCYMTSIAAEEQTFYYCGSYLPPYLANISGSYISLGPVSIGYRNDGSFVALTGYDYNFGEVVSLYCSVNGPSPSSTADGFILPLGLNATHVKTKISPDGQRVCHSYASLQGRRFVACKNLALSNWSTGLFYDTVNAYVDAGVRISYWQPSQFIL